MSNNDLRAARAAAAVRGAMLCIAVVIGVTGCAANPNPIVNRQGVDPAAYQRDLSECSRYADEVPIAAGAAKGAVAGGAYGAAVGSIERRRQRKGRHLSHQRRGMVGARGGPGKAASRQALPFRTRLSRTELS